MKALFTSALLALLLASTTTVQARNWRDDYLGLPGDNLNLYATMKLFQESETLEAFERDLNSEDMGINNLDLNGDRLVDYINVTDYVEGRVHNIVLSVALNKKQRQDVAVFIVERFRDGSVQIQLVGDEALYGRNYIVEPYYDNNYAGTANPGYYGRPRNRAQVDVIITSVWEIADWPVVRYIYYPGYLAWHSPWYWGYWPAYYTAWRPWYWHYYYGYHYNLHPDYYAHFRHWNHVRYHGYYDFYYAGVRNWSKDVHRNIKKGYYQNTYSRPELQKEGRALYSRVATENNRTRVSAGSREASATRLSSAVPETARVRSASTVTARRSDATVVRRAGSKDRTPGNGAVPARQETQTVRSRREAGTSGTRVETSGRPETGINARSRNQTVEPTQNAVPDHSGTPSTRSSSTRPANVRETPAAVSGESRTRENGVTTPEMSGRPAATRSTETYSAPRTRTEAAPRVETSGRPETGANAGSRNQTVEPTRNAALEHSGTTYTRSSSARPANVRETPAAVSGESRTRESGVTTPGATSRPAATRSTETYSAPRTRTEAAPRTTTTVRQESSSGTSSGRVSTRTPEDSGSTKVASRPSESYSNTHSGSVSRSSSQERSSSSSSVRSAPSPESSPRGSVSAGESSSSRSRR